MANPTHSECGHENCWIACPRCGSTGYLDVLGRRFCSNPGCTFTGPMNPDCPPATLTAADMTTEGDI